mmetsp:Transcript_21234/g.25108  ORF Transcript_21234/g.25108 Transcript_21234/m.25108 type:complete len:133 (-) Transcript_21234:91-489(-)
MDIVQQYLALAIQFIEHNGWYLVAMAILWYMVKDTVLQHLAENERQSALKKARDPNRVSLLETERRKARDKQQQRAEEEAIAAKERMKQEKAERTKKEEAKTRKPPSNNPLDRGSSGGTYKPTRRNISRGGG